MLVGCMAAPSEVFGFSNCCSRHLEILRNSTSAWLHCQVFTVGLHWRLQDYSYINWNARPYIRSEWKVFAGTMMGRRQIMCKSVAGILYIKK